MIKRLIALLLVLIFSIESFAAVVSDNDGSAFITKAEFDSLKNNFQSQIDQYNTSIDSKIDGAIASYLAGIQVSKSTTKSILVKNWDNINMMNGVLANTFQYPNIAGAFSIHIAAKTAVITDNDVVGSSIGGNPAGSHKIVTVYANFNYSNSKNTNRRNLVTNVGIGATLDTSNMTWAGQALNVTEEWTINEIVEYTRNVDSESVTSFDPAYMDNRWDNNFYIQKYLNLDCDGYMPSFVNKSAAYWKPAVRWSYRTSTSSPTYYSNWGIGNIRAVSTIPAISYNNDASCKTFDNLHVCNWKKENAWEVTVKDVVNYAKCSSNNSLRTEGWDTQITTKSGKWHGFEAASWNSSSGGVNDHSRIVAFKTNRNCLWSEKNESGDTNNKQIPTLGLLANTYKADAIYQYSNGDIIDDDGMIVPRVTLQQGAPICKVKAGEIIEWEPTFKDINVTGVSGVNECRVILAYTPFTDYGNPSSTDDYVKMDGITKGEWATTTGKKVKIKFEADRDSYVYVKWVPNADWSIVNGSTYWATTIDLANCSTYISTTES